MIFSGALGVHSDVYVYIYISLSLACPWTQQSASQLVFSNFSIKTYYPQSNVASWEIPKGNGGVVRWESHIDFPSRARQLAPVASQVRKAFANFMCGAPDFKNWNPKIGISIVNDLQIDFLTIGTCLPDSWSVNLGTWWLMINGYFSVLRSHVADIGLFLVVWIILESWERLRFRSQFHFIPGSPG